MSDFDEKSALTDDPGLRDLLAHYVELWLADREAWRDRVTDGDKRDLTRLHGELLAAGWIELRTAFPIPTQAGQVPLSYRATTAGRSALRDAEGLAGSCDVNVARILE